jgi:dolichol-phosphate mannosyltransferase
MSLENRVGIVIPARNEWHLADGGGLLEKVLQEVPRDLHPQIFVCVNNSDPKFVGNLREVEAQDDRIKVIDLGMTEPLGWAYAYLYGLSVAKEWADKIVEMDANGSHNPEYIPEFLERLNHSAAAFSTRFSHGGRIDRYPEQRKLISAGGTILANLVLGLGKYIPDMTSGYEAFRREVLGDVIAKQPIESWVSVAVGPGHFFQTEMRARIIWRHHSYDMVPIIWGTDRMSNPDNLSVKEVLRALRSLFVLRGMKESLK